MPSSPFPPTCSLQPIKPCVCSFLGGGKEVRRRRRRRLLKTMFHFSCSQYSTTRTCTHGVKNVRFFSGRSGHLNKFPLCTEEEEKERGGYYAFFPTSHNAASKEQKHRAEHKEERAFSSFSYHYPPSLKHHPPKQTHARQVVLKFPYKVA